MTDIYIIIFKIYCKF